MKAPHASTLRPCVLLVFFLFLFAPVSSLSAEPRALPFLSDADTVFDWAEREHAVFFNPAGIETQIIPPYAARYYPGSDTWIATDGNHLFLYGAVFSAIDPVGADGVKKVATLTDMLALAAPPLSEADRKLAASLTSIEEIENRLVALYNSGTDAEAALRNTALSLEGREDMVGVVLDDPVTHLNIFFKSGLQYFIPLQEFEEPEAEASIAALDAGNRNASRALEKGGAIPAEHFLQRQIPGLPDGFPEIPGGFPEISTSDTPSDEPDNTIGLPDSNRALIAMGPVFCDGYDEMISQLVKPLIEGGGYKLDYLKAEVDVFEHLTDYGLIFIDSRSITHFIEHYDPNNKAHQYATLIRQNNIAEFFHHDPDHPTDHANLPPYTDLKGNLELIHTTTPATMENILLYSDDIRWGRIQISSKFEHFEGRRQISRCPPALCITPNFIEKYAEGKSFPDNTVIIINDPQAWDTTDNPANGNGEGFSFWYRSLKHLGDNLRFYGWGGGKSNTTPSRTNQLRTFWNFFEIAFGAEVVYEEFDLTTRILTPPLPNYSLDVVNAAMTHNGYNLDLTSGHYFSNTPYGELKEEIKTKNISFLPLINRLSVDSKGWAYLLSFTPHPEARLIFENAPAGSNTYELGVYNQTPIQSDTHMFGLGNWKFKLPAGVNGPFVLALADGRKSTPATLLSWQPTFTLTGTNGSGAVLTATLRLLFRAMVTPLLVDAGPSDLMGIPHYDNIQAVFEEEGSTLGWEVIGSASDNETNYQYTGSHLGPPSFTSFSTAFDTFQGEVAVMRLFLDPIKNRIQYKQIATSKQDGSQSTTLHDLELPFFNFNIVLGKDLTIKAGKESDLSHGEWTFDVHWNDASPTPKFDHKTTRH